MLPLATHVGYFGPNEGLFLCDRRTILASTTIRFYGCVPLSLSAANDGLALLIVVLKTIAARKRSELLNRAASFWIRIFGLSFAVGVVTGIPNGVSIWYELGSVQ